MWDNPHVITLKADDRRRVQLPDIKPGQVFALETPGEGQFVLTLVKKADIKEPFPEGSLKHLVSKANDNEMLAIHRGCVQGPGPDDE
jgi:hypothetical protein